MVKKLSPCRTITDFADSCGYHSSTSLKSNEDTDFPEIFERELERRAHDSQGRSKNYGNQRTVC